MGNRILVFYGSYRSDRMGIRLAQFVVERLRRRGDDAELIDAKAINLPMLDRMYKEYPKGQAPEPLERLAGKIRDADGFVFVTGRIKELIIKGGENIAPREIDEALLKHPAVLEAAAVGIADRDYGQEILACVVLKPGAACSIEELRAHCLRELGRY